MLKDRWAVPLASANTLRRIPEEQVIAGTQVDGEDGRKLLVYRDHFTALKAAFYAGTRAQRGRIVEDDGRPRRGAVKLGNGELLLLVDRPEVFPQDVAPQRGARPRRRASRSYAPVTGSSLQRPNPA